MSEAADQSPCIKVCVLDPKTGYCIGCGRTAAEIGAWMSFDPNGRSDVLAALPERLAAMTSRRVRKAAGERRSG